MGKLLFILLAFAIAYWLLRGYGRSIGQQGGPRTRDDRGEDMVRCVQCGVHLPRSESLMSGQNFYCTPEHRRLHQGAQR